MKAPIIRNLLIIGLLLTGLPAFSQDIIQRTDGVKVEARVLEIKGTQIFYKKFAQPEGPTYVLSKESVQQINYQNGTQQKFANPPPIITRPVVEMNHGQHVVSVRPLDLLFPNLTLTYERLSRSARFGFKVPLSFGIGHQLVKEDHHSFYYQYNKVFSTGLELNFYVGVPGRVRYFVGPALQLGSFRYTYVTFSPSSPATSDTSVGQHVAILINNGAWFQLDRHFVLTMDLGLGWQNNSFDQEGNYANYYYYQVNTSRLNFSGNVNLGYQF